MKRFAAMFSAVLMLLLATVTVFPSAGVYAESVSDFITIANQSPAITDTVNETIVLGDYQVELDDGTLLQNPIWTYEGNTVTELNFEESGVYTLTATENDKSRTVYAVIKNADETEYVLYRNDFETEDDLNELKKISGSGSAVVKDGKMVLTTTNQSNTLYTLPDWIADFGNYNIEVNASMISSADASRWFAICYRQSGGYYMDMCVRKNMSSPGTASSGGIECVMWNGAWRYLFCSSYKSNMDYGKYYTFNVNVYQNTLQYCVEGTPVIHMDDMTKNPGQITGLLTKGNICLQGNSSEMRFDYIKVTVAEKAAEKPEAPDIPDPLIASEHSQTNLLNAVSNISIVKEADLESVLSEAVKPNSVFAKYDGDITAEKLNALHKLCLENKVVPGVYINSEKDVDTLAKWCDDSEFYDITAVGANGELLKALRTKKSVIRTVLILDSVADKSAQSVRETARGYAVNGIIIPQADAKSAVVRALQQLHLTVWVQGEQMSVTDIVWAISSGAHGVVSDTPQLVTEVMQQVFGKDTLTKTPSIIGHRGNPSQAPENSISGFVTAVKNGATEIECDIYLTKDKEIIILHDNTLTRTTNYTGGSPVTSMTLAQIKEYFLLDKNGKVTEEKVPTLKEFFEALKDYDVYYVIELKSGDQGMVEPLYQLIKEYGVADRVNIISFAGDVLNKTYTTDPIISAGYLSGNIQFNENYYDLATVNTNIFNLIKSAQLYNSTVNISYGNTTQRFYQILNDRGITLWPWTYGNNDANLYNGFLWGFDGLTTDYCQNVKNTVRFFDVDKSGENSLCVGESLTVKATATTYGDEVKDVLKPEIVWIENDIGASYDAETATFTAGTQSGTASFMFNYSCRLPNGKNYVLYSQPVTVNVSEPIVSEDASDIFGEYSAVVIGAVIAMIAACAAVVIVVLKKKK